MTLDPTPIKRGGDPENVADATRAAGFQLHITKPCDPSTLVHIARTLLEREN